MGRSKLHRQYYDQKRVGSYGGVAALQRVVPAERDVERWLSTQDAYTLHKPVRRRFKRRCVVVGGPNQQWQADLVDMSRLKQANNEITFLLTVIDVFSKRAWCIPLKSKSAAALVTAFTPLLNNRAPTTLQTDKGSEFLNRPLQRLLKEYGVHHFTTHNEDTKASIVERYNKTLKTRMWRYFTNNQTLRYVDVLQDFVRSYNDTYHRSIGMAPSAVNGANQEMVWQRLYGHDGGGTPKYRVGDRVRISKAKRHFAKGYMANWTEELFTIVDVHRSDPPVYRLVDWNGDSLDGTFYEPELQKVIVSADKTYRVEAELRRRNNGREVLVKPLQPNFETGQYIRSYVNLFSATGKHAQDEGNELTRDDFGNGYTFFGFDLTPDACDGSCLHKVQKGNLRIEIHFAEALTQTVNVIVYAEFEAVLEIDKGRNIIYNHP